MELSQFQTVQASLYGQSFEELKQQMVLIKEIQEDPSYGSGLIMQHKRANVPLYYHVKTFDVEEAFTKSKEEAAVHLQMTQPTIVKLIKFQTTQHSALCGSMYKINFIFEYSQDSLFDLIEKRKVSKQSFSEGELYFILDCVLSALISLSSQNIRHGAVQPKNIYAKTINNDQIFQLTDIRYLTELYEYKRQVMGFTEGCYLSPSLLQELGRRTFNPIYNYEKSEIFSLGVTICEAALLKSIGSIYDLHNFTVSNVNITTYLTEINDRYSEQFCDLVKWMLQVNETQRCSASDLAHELQYQFQPQGSYSFLLLKSLKNKKHELQYQPSTKSRNDTKKVEQLVSQTPISQPKLLTTKYTPSPIQTTQYTRSVSPQPTLSRNTRNYQTNVKQTQTLTPTNIRTQIMTPSNSRPQQIFPRTKTITRPFDFEPQDTKNKSTSNPFDFERPIIEDSYQIHKHSESYISPEARLKAKSQISQISKISPNVSPSKYVPPKVVKMKDSLNKKMHEFDEELKDIRSQFQSLHQQYQHENKYPEVMNNMREDPLSNSQREQFRVADKAYKDTAYQLALKQPTRGYDQEPPRRQEKEPLRRQEYEPPKRQEQEPPRRQDLEHPKRQEYEPPKRQEYDPPKRQVYDPLRRLDHDPSRRDQMNEISEILSPDLKNQSNYYRSKPGHIVVESIDVDDTWRDQDMPNQAYTFKPSYADRSPDRTPEPFNKERRHNNNPSPYDNNIKIQSPRDNNDQYVSESYKQLDYKLSNPKFKDAIMKLSTEPSRLDYTPTRHKQEPQIEAKLPQSSMIHMHAKQQPSYLNDMFYKSEGRYQQ